MRLLISLYRFNSYFKRMFSFIIYKIISWSESFFIVNFFIYYQNFSFFFNLLTILPEVMVFIYLIYSLLNSTIINSKKLSLYSSSLNFYLILCIFLFSWYFLKSTEVSTSIVFGYFLIISFYTQISKVYIILLTTLVLVISKYRLKENNVEFIVVINFSLFFLLVLSSVYDFFVFYLVMEGLSLTLYVLAGMSNKSIVSIESSLKYFSLGAFSSGILLLGICFLYGLVGSLNFLDIQVFFANINNLFEIKVTVILIIFGLLFKLGAFPCNWWLPDVYEGVWTPITAFFAIVIKTALFLFFFRLIFSIFYSILFILQNIFFIVICGSLLVGTFGALKQLRIKRFLAYASINQVGFIFFGLACGNIGGLVASLIYVFLYSLMSVLFFSIILQSEHLLTNKTVVYLSDFYTLESYSTKNLQYLIVAMFSMAGLPPLGGFVGKLLLYIVAIDSRLDFVVFFSLFLSIISTYYYINFIHYLWFIKLNLVRLFFFNYDKLINSLLLSLVICLLFFVILLPFCYTIFYSLAFSCVWCFF